MGNNLNAVLALGYRQPPGYYEPPQSGSSSYPSYPPTYPSNYAPYPRRIGPIRPFIPLIALSLVAMILMILAMVTPWYGLYIKSSGGEVKGEYFFSEIKYEGKAGGMTWTESTSWSKYSETTKNDIHKDPKLPIIYFVTEILVIIAMIMAILGFVFVILNLVGRTRGMVAGKVTLFLLIGAILGLVAILLFAATHTWAMNEDTGPYTTDWGPHKSLFGTKSESGTDYLWTLSYGWFLALVATVLMFVAMVMSRREVAPSAPRVQMDARAVPGAPGYYQLPAEPDYSPSPGIVEEYPPPPPRY